MRTLVTIDLGNSRLKWRRWEVAAGAAPRKTGAGDHPARAGVAAALLADLLAGEPERVALACVATPALEDELVSALRARFGERVEPRPDPGLELDVEQPETVGRDRLFAARGAWERLRSGALVIDAGTCVTVDAIDTVLVRGATSPRFRGGAIAPGLELLSGALANGGARLFAVDVRGPVAPLAPLGRNTESALRAGIVVGLRGAVRELVTEIAAAAGLAEAPLAWTGGAAPLLCKPPLFPARKNLLEPELVHLGLLASTGVDVLGPG